MKALIVASHFLLFAPFVKAQCDSLEIAAKAKTSPERVDALNEYARCYMGPNFPKADSLTKLANKLAIEIGYESGRARSIQNLGMLQQYYVGDSEKAFELYNEAMSFYISAGDSMGVAKSCSDIGAYYNGIQDFANALLYFIRGLNISQRQKSEKGITVFSDNIGVIFLSTGQSREALPYLFKARDHTDSLVQPINYANHLSNIGAAYAMHGRDDSARWYYRRAINYNTVQKNYRVVAKDYKNLASITGSDNSSKEKDRLKSYADSLLKYAGILNSKQDSINAQVIYGEYYLHKGDFDLSYEYFNSVEEYKDILITESPNFYSDYLYKYSYSLYKTGRVIKAYELLNFQKKYSDSLQIAGKTKLLLEMKSKFQVDEAQKELSLVRKDKQIAELDLKASEAENKRKSEEAKRKDQQLYAILGGLLLTLILAVVAIRGFLNKRKANTIITRQKDQVDEAFGQLAEKNKEIVDSINYAKRIQSAILPSQKAMNELLPNSFTIYEPKDIVAGDFYWLESKDGATLFAVADCTGHGVPGAMVSVICNNGLNRSVRENGLTIPSEILDKTREIVIAEFEKSEEEVKDGMDIALCKIENNQLSYAGANNPLWVVRKKSEWDGNYENSDRVRVSEFDDYVLIDFRADRLPIGKFDELLPYTTHDIDIKPNDSIYIFSDGYADQFGGDNGKKLKTSVLKSWLMEIQDKPIEEQGRILRDRYFAWMGDHEQIDDVCMIGIKL